VRGVASPAGAKILLTLHSVPAESAEAEHDESVMPKVKTNRAAKKRFRKTGGGKIKRNSAFRRHLLTSKPPGRKRRLRKAAYVHPSDERELQKLLPN
jgi:large subunit ribosomal protein L35